MVFHFAANDALGPPETREKIQAALAVNPLIEHYVYPDCDHAFATPGANTSTNPQP
jgi:carboxymethylenebutenolidase